MPELPEAERARREIERTLGRAIVAVDDTDGYVCRPHAPGEIEAALLGRSFTRACRRGKFLWVETSAHGPDLGLHLGMAGSIRVDQPPAPGAWDRFSVEFQGGGRLALHDKRRLGRAVLEPDFSHVGPDAGTLPLDAFAERFPRGGAPVKARLLDQGVLAGVGNLLADQALWQARIPPGRPAGDLRPVEVRRLHEELQAAIADAIRRGGVHTGEFVPQRRIDGACPRCGSPPVRQRLGGRTTWSCPRCQADSQARVEP